MRVPRQGPCGSATADERAAGVPLKGRLRAAARLAGRRRRIVVGVGAGVTVLVAAVSIPLAARGHGVRVRQPLLRGGLVELTVPVVATGVRLHLDEPPVITRQGDVAGVRAQRVGVPGLSARQMGAVRSELLHGLPGQRPVAGTARQQPVRGVRLGRVAAQTQYRRNRHRHLDPAPHRLDPRHTRVSVPSGPHGRAQARTLLGAHGRPVPAPGARRHSVPRPEHTECHRPRVRC